MSQTTPRPSQDSLTEVEIHEILSNRRRLAVLKLLREEPEEEKVSLRDLSTRVASLETGESPPPTDARQSVYVSLHQNHLPRMAERGIIEYDEQAKTVTLAEHSAEVSVYLETVPKHGLAWSEYYTGLAVLGFLLVFGADAGVPGLAAVGPTAAAAVGFGLVVAAGLYRTRQQGESIVSRIRERGE